jgi:hypothetical protein
MVVPTAVNSPLPTSGASWLACLGIQRGISARIGGDTAQSLCGVLHRRLDLRRLYGLFLALVQPHEVMHSG